MTNVSLHQGFVSLHYNIVNFLDIVSEIRGEIFYTIIV